MFSNDRLTSSILKRRKGRCYKGGMTPSPSSSTVALLSDDVLLAHVTTLAARERQATADLIAALAELDGRRLYLGAGCSSLFTHCTQVLHLSEHAAYGRIEAARLARRIPGVIGRLADGSLTLTARSTSPFAPGHERHPTRSCGGAAGGMTPRRRAVRVVGTHGRCTERGFLEFHHVVPFADGGEASVSNIQLRCRAHNQHEAALSFGAYVVREGSPVYASGGLGPDRVLKFGRSQTGEGPVTDLQRTRMVALPKRREALRRC